MQEVWRQFPDVDRYKILVSSCSAGLDLRCSSLGAGELRAVRSHCAVCAPGLLCEAPSLLPPRAVTASQQLRGAVMRCGADPRQAWCALRAWSEASLEQVNGDVKHIVICTDGWMDGWMDGQMGRWMDGRAGGRMNGRKEGWMNGWMVDGGRKDGRVDE